MQSSLQIKNCQLYRQNELLLSLNEQVNGGEILTIRGITHLKYTKRIYYHEDCYDLGALVYEHVPVLGGITRSLKSRLADQSD